MKTNRTPGTPSRKTPATSATPGTPATMHATILRIAREQLDLETLETRHSDRLDFQDQAVWGIAAALEAAYRAGMAEAKKRTPRK